MVDHDALREAVLAAAVSARVVVRVSDPVRRSRHQFCIKVMVDILAGELEPPRAKVDRLRDAVENALPDVHIANESAEGVVQGLRLTYDDR